MKKIAIALLSLSLISASLTACEKVPQSVVEETTDGVTADNAVTTVPETRPGGKPQDPGTSDLLIYDYEEVDDGIRLTRYRGNDTAIIIPKSIDGKPVVELADTFFHDDRRDYLQTVVSITALSIKRVDWSSFRNVRNVEEIYMPLLEELPEYLFAYCQSLQIVDIPAATNIGASAFYDCDSLKRMSLPVATDVGNSAFFGCSSLLSVNLPVATNIGKNAFSGCSSLLSLNLPEVTCIESFAFADCSWLPELKFSKLTRVGACAFYNCSFTELYLPNVTELDEKALVGSAVRTIHGEVGSYAEEWAKSRAFGFVDVEHDYTPTYSDDDFNRYKYEFYDFSNYKPSGISYAHGYGKYYLYVDVWDEAILIPGELVGMSSATVYGDTVLLADVSSMDENTATRLYVVKFTRGQEEFETYEIDLDEALLIKNVFCNLVDSQTGFLFLFVEQYNNLGYKNSFLTLKTEDGGKTWNWIRCPDPPVFHYNDDPVMAKYITDQIGIFSYHDHRDWNENVCCRTYLTVNGGMTWDLLTCMPDPMMGYPYGHAEAVDFSCIDGIYWLEIQVYYGDQCDTLRYFSTDLILWQMESSFFDASTPPRTNPYGITENVMFLYRSIAEKEEKNLGKDNCHSGGDFASFTSVDLDGDGRKEVLIRSLNTVVIWRRVDRSVYVYSVPLEDLYAVDSNGVCYWRSENASGAYRLSFTETECYRTEIYRVENEGTGQAIYFIGEVKVSKTDFEAYLNTLDGEVLHWYHRFCGHPSINGKPEYEKPWGGK